MPTYPPFLATHSPQARALYEMWGFSTDEQLFGAAARGIAATVWRAAIEDAHAQGAVSDHETSWMNLSAVRAMGRGGEIGF